MMAANKVSRQRRWQLLKVANGKCMQCGKDRPDDLSLRCRLCQDKQNGKQRAGTNNNFTGSTGIPQYGYDPQTGKALR